MLLLLILWFRWTVIILKICRLLGSLRRLLIRCWQWGLKTRSGKISLGMSIEPRGNSGMGLLDMLVISELFCLRVWCRCY